MTHAYLDHAATTPLRPAAHAAMLEAMAIFGNPSSVHQPGQKARALLDSARRTMADALGVRAERVMFTSGGTESNNLALRGLMAALPGKRLLVGATEHDCVLNTAKVLGGGTVPVDENGVLKLDMLESELKKQNIGLVSVMHANNETGTLQPVEAIAKLCHAHGALFHTDAVQTVGHMPVRPDDMGADLLSLSAHKFGGPKGVGALVAKPELPFMPQLIGGAQERGRRAGTENMPGICGMAAALGEAGGAEVERMRGLMEHLARGVKELKGVSIVAEQAACLPHILQLRASGKSGEDLVMALDLAGVAASQGSACSSGRVGASHVLMAMGYSEKEASEGLRLSLGWNSTKADIDTALRVLPEVLGMGA